MTVVQTPSSSATNATLPATTSYLISTEPSSDGTFRIAELPDGSLQLCLAGGCKLVPELENRIHSIIGLWLGDEGKGRTVPELVRILRTMTALDEPVAIVAKVNGGANSGHSIVIEFEGSKVKLGLNLIPTGVSEKRIRHLALGGGVLADPFKLSSEGDFLESYKLNLWARMLIDENTMVSDISHRIRDMAREESRPDPRGSTGRGISPGYEDEADFSAIRWSIFRSGNFEAFEAMMQERLNRCAKRAQYECGWNEKRWNISFDELTAKEILANKAALERRAVTPEQLDIRRFRGDQPFTFNSQRMIREYWEEGVKRKASIVDVGALVQQILDGGLEHVICEHGQALALDKRNGVSTSRTASHTGTAEIYHSFRLPPAIRINIIGVDSVIGTGVGNHKATLLTRMNPDHGEDVILANLLRPGEKGVTTGRQREVAHYDAVQIAHSQRTHGFNSKVTNRLDLLTHREEWQGNLKLCIGYERPDGEKIQFFPHDAMDRADLKPIYLEVPGWNENLSVMRSFHQLPEAAQRYLATTLVAPTKIAERGLNNPPPPPRLLFAGVGPGDDEIVRDIPDYHVLEALAYPFEIFGPPPPARE